jgi:hypothetical protein
MMRWQDLQLFSAGGYGACRTPYCSSKINSTSSNLIAEAEDMAGPVQMGWRQVLFNMSKLSFHWWIKSNMIGLRCILPRHYKQRILQFSYKCCTEDEFHCRIHTVYLSTSSDVFKAKETRLHHLLHWGATSTKAPAPSPHCSCDL